MIYTNPNSMAALPKVMIYLKIFKHENAYLYNTDHSIIGMRVPADLNITMKQIQDEIRSSIGDEVDQLVFVYPRRLNLEDSKIYQNEQTLAQIPGFDRGDTLYAFFLQKENSQLKKEKRVNDDDCVDGSGSTIE